VDVSNAGPDAASSVRLVDRLPNPVTFVDVAAPGASCERPSKGRIVCTVDLLAAGAGFTATIRVTPKHNEPRFSIVNVATVGKRKTDSRLANNTSRERTVVENTPPVICAGRVATIVGTDGPDNLVGTDGPDVIAAFSGDDDIIGLGGNDVVCGSGGRDAVRGGSGDDAIKAGGGHDRLKGEGGDDRLQGKGGPDSLKGGRGNDVLKGGRGPDRCRGGGGVDIRRSC
jgi:Ca2+-binding RTX toxin-like protein